MRGARCVGDRKRSGQMQRDVPQLVGEFLDSLRTYIGSGEVDLSAGLTLSKKSLDGMGAPLALLLEHGAIKECGPTSYKLPKPLVSHLRAECRVHGRIDGPRSLPTALDLAELCQHLVPSGKAVLEPGTLFKGVAPNQHRQLRRLHPVPAARVIAPTPPGCEADLLHDWPHSCTWPGMPEGILRRVAFVMPSEPPSELAELLIRAMNRVQPSTGSH